MDELAEGMYNHPSTYKVPETHVEVIDLPEYDPATVDECDALLSYLHWKSEGASYTITKVYETLIDRYLDLRNELSDAKR